MNTGLRKILITVTLLALLAGMVIAVASTNFSLLNYIFANGGGKTYSSSYTNIGTSGQNIAGKTSSSRYTTGGGFISIINAVSEPVPAPDLEGTKIYPNPYKPGSGGKFDADFITFADLTRQCRIQVFNIAGELVATLDKDNEDRDLTWEPENDAGLSLASGVYIYYITNDAGDKTVGKFAIVK